MACELDPPRLTGFFIMEQIKINGIYFKQIKNCPNYYVSKLGDVYSLTSNKILKKCFSMGYYHVNISNSNYKRKSIKIHRLVAETFIDNTNGFTDVNHINGIKTDNNVDNLEWCSRSYNCKHACKIGLNKISDRSKTQISGNHPRAKSVIDTINNIIYPSVSDAANAISMKRTTLIAMLKGVNKNKTNLSYLESF